MSISVYTPSSSSIVHDTRVDFQKRSVQTVVHIVQYDKSLPIVAVELYSGGRKWALPSDVDYVRIRWGKRDHTYVNTDALGCNEDRTVVYFEIIDQMTVFSGAHNPVLEVIMGLNVACSSPIPFYVDRNPIQPEDVESHVTPTIVEQLRAEIDARALPEATISDYGKVAIVNAQGQWVLGDPPGGTPLYRHTITFTVNGNVNLSIILISTESRSFNDWMSSTEGHPSVKDSRNTLINDSNSGSIYGAQFDLLWIIDIGGTSPAIRIINVTNARYDYFTGFSNFNDVVTSFA